MANPLLSVGYLWMTPALALKFYPASQTPREGLARTTEFFLHNIKV
ncbi:hypothetical protein PS914_05502 [Pseudomonas fluorescens]|uniref:Uncharacterized protein n=1 Tax=Pseudomonas fluorescens TaxID=294 RepID=A0A5E7UTR2_PSEFL|nr:hypothetical protein PS833_03649 [Pseudomonas fluorescens]VVQ13596.1 hypothetical protein PS914_05502 [Pseudomonas fluorescens]